MANVLVKSRQFQEKLARIIAIFRDLSIVPEDFQFMFFYDQSSTRVDVKLIDTALYSYTKGPAAAQTEGYQGLEFIFTELDDASSSMFRDY